VSRETISRFTDKVVEEMNDWSVRPLDAIYAAIFIDAIVVKVRGGQVANCLFYAAIGVTLDGGHDRRCGGNRPSTRSPSPSRTDSRPPKPIDGNRRKHR
jgi:hypothetical protein